MISVQLPSLDLHLIHNAGRRELAQISSEARGGTEPLQSSKVKQREYSSATYTCKKYDNIIEDLKVNTIIPSVSLIALYCPIPQWSRLSARPRIACAAQVVSWETDYFPSDAVLPCDGWEQGPGCWFVAHVYCYSAERRGVA